MVKYYQFVNDNGIFICFNEFPTEEDFINFVKYLEEKLGTQIRETKKGPYSLLGEAFYKNNLINVMFHEDTGCCIRVDTKNEKLANEIRSLCFM